MSSDAFSIVQFEPLLCEQVGSESFVQIMEGSYIKRNFNLNNKQLQIGRVVMITKTDQIFDLFSSSDPCFVNSYLNHWLT